MDNAPPEVCLWILFLYFFHQDFVNIHSLANSGISASMGVYLPAVVRQCLELCKPVVEVWIAKTSVVLLP